MRAVAARFNETVERLDALLHSQQEFVADASHQLRTPLTALRLRLENLERDVAEGARSDLEAALAEVERLARLVDGLLVLARADAAQPASEPVDLAAVAAARVDSWSLQASASERNVELQADVPAGLKGLASHGSLEQVLDNLLSNALAVSPPGSAIRIEGSGAGDAVELRVSDEGPGMSADQRARAFDRFWRAGPPGTGTGLGLAVVHRLIAADGGTIELRDGPRGGLEAVITLRAAAPPAPNPYLRLARA